MKRLVSIIASAFIVLSPLTVSASTVVNNNYTVRIDFPSAVVKGSILRSINNEINAFYNPNFDEVSFLKEQLIKDMDRAAVYSGEWDLNKKIFNRLPNRRELEILGNDILLKSEDYSNGSYNAVNASYNESITLDLAVMAMYKALGENYYKHSFILRDNGSSNLAVGNTPFAEVVPAVSTYVSNKGYYADTFVTRTVPAKYWEKANLDGIISSNYESGKSQQLTVGEFAFLVKSMLDLKGEPVLNEIETNQLLVTYGKDLPLYLPSHQLEAIKYLVARGIVESTMNFNQVLNGESMISILMRAKDKNSRLDFKVLEIQFEHDLVGKGFFPAELTVTESPISGLEFTVDYNSVNYYDYYLQINSKTEFRNKNGVKLSNLYISDKGNDRGSKLANSSYEGIKNGYYHFRVPINNLGNALYSYNGKTYITVNTPSEFDNPGNILLEVGGGVYSLPEEIPNNTGDGLNYYYSNRVPFSSSFDKILVDADRRGTPTLLARFIDLINPIKKVYAASPDYKINFELKPADVNNVTIDNKPVLSLCEEVPNHAKYICSIDVTNSTNPVETFLNALKVNTNSSGNASTLPAYIKDANTLLISSEFLFEKTNFSSISGSNGIYKVIGSSGTLYIDTNKRISINGQVVTEFTNNDVIIQKSSFGETYYIDYRTVSSELGWYLKNDNGVMSLLTNVTDSTDNYAYVDLNIPMSDNVSYEVVTRLDGSDIYMSLENPYPLSSSFIFKKNIDIDEDFLIVFKAKTKNSYTSDEVYNYMSSVFKLEVNKDKYDVSIYSLGTSVFTQDFIKKVESDSIILDDKIGYMFKVPEIGNYSTKNALNLPYTFHKIKSSSNTEYTYMDLERLGDIEFRKQYLSAPAITKRSNEITIYDMNFNNFKSSGMGTNVVPIDLLNSKVKNALGITTSVFKKYNIDTKISEGNSSVGLEMDLAPIGVTSLYQEEDLVKASSLISGTSSNKKVALGTILTTVSEDLKHKDNALIDEKLYKFTLLGNYLSLGRGDVDLLPIAETSDVKNTVYSPYSEFGVVLQETKAESSKAETWVESFLGRNIFNWEEYRLQLTLEGFDSTLTHIFTFIFVLFPRFILFIFLCLATLSLIKDWPIVEALASKLFDPFKILSFGVTNITQVKASSMWASTFAAAILIGMVNSESVTTLARIFGRFIEFIMK